ncbi:SHSP domain-containing protein [Meloidogyne graminicola]|uniref:SHSP domain-containing protein n=1 Tax=Meloidogyne graminicola TaxID=189291 RepID=A0A8S9ZDR4_9BILA|nr:SHSP domain-containing protein [Meloidogyne graminicola]
MFTPAIYNAFGTAPANRRVYRRNWMTDPFDQIDRWVNSMDRYFDEQTGFQMRDHSAKLMIEPNGDFTYKVDASGFRPEELKVEVHGNEIVISGEHQEKNQGESVHRQFVRRVCVPEGIKNESIKCDMDNAGHLCVTAKQNIEGKRSIPIEFKPANTTTTTATGGGKAAPTK